LVGATQPLPRDGGMEELHGDLAVEQSWSIRFCSRSIWWRLLSCQDQEWWGQIRRSNLKIWAIT